MSTRIYSDLRELSALQNFNFGVQNSTVVVTIANPDITTDNFKSISFLPLASADHDLDDFDLDQLKFNIENIVNNVSFDLRATAPNMTFGTFTIRYKILYE
jgi:hypothetical protein